MFNCTTFQRPLTFPSRVLLISVPIGSEKKNISLSKTKPNLTPIETSKIFYLSFFENLLFCSSLRWQNFLPQLGFVSPSGWPSEVWSTRSTGGGTRRKNTDTREWFLQIKERNENRKRRRKTLFNKNINDNYKSRDRKKS